MALVLANRVRETTTTTGTGTITLAGAVTGYQSFAAIGNSNTTYYTISGQGTSQWEVGIGTYTASGTTLSRDTVLASSNSGSLVSFSAGTKDVFVTYPSNKSVYLDASGNASSLGTPAAFTATNVTGLPVSTGISGLGTGVATALGVNTGSAGAFVVNGGALGTPSSGTVTNLTGTASINTNGAHNGTVGATTPNTVAATTGAFSSELWVTGALTSHAASKVSLTQQSASQSQLSAYGANDATAGTLTIKCTSSAGGINVAPAVFSSTGLAVTGTGSVTTGFAVGGATPGTGGVAFPATAVAVSDANTLDDYEEGTWTPSLGGTATYTTRAGVYVKIGRLVWIRFTIRVNSIGTGSGTGAISGLPFTSAAYGSAIRGAALSVCWFDTLSSNQIFVSCGVNDSASTLQCTAIAAAGTAMSAASGLFTNGTAIEVAGCYQV